MRKLRSLRRWWANVTLKNKITGLTVCILALGLFVAGIGTFSLLRPTLVASQDADLKELRINPTKALRAGAKADSLSLADIQQAPNSHYVALLNGLGNIVVDNSTHHHKTVPRLPEMSGSWAQQNQDSVFVFSPSDGADWRGVIVPIQGDNNGILVIAYSTSQINAIVAEYATIFTGFGLAVILLGAVMTRILIAATLDPLVEVQRTAQKISEGDYAQRIRISTPHNEVGLVGNSLNSMLDKVDEAIGERDETLAKMRQFIGDAGHELRTPLVTLRGYAELYRMGGLSDKEQLSHAIKRIEDEAIRMTSLVEDLLSLARLEGSRELKLKPLDLNAFANDAALDATARDPERKITAVLDPRRPYALGDEHKVRQLMMNLLGNAFKHTDPGTPLEIVVTHTEKYACFEVRDHGEGIPAEIKGKIFDRFWRADTSRNRETGGSGLGLAIVSSIVAAHGGEIDVLETANGGATFKISLPLATHPAASEFSDDADAAELEDEGKSTLRSLFKRIIPARERADEAAPAAGDAPEK